MNFEETISHQRREYTKMIRYTPNRERESARCRERRGSVSSSARKQVKRIVVADSINGNDAKVNRKETQEQEKNKYRVCVCSELQMDC